MDSRKWTDEDDIFLQRHYGKITREDIAEHLGRTISSINNRVFQKSLTKEQKRISTLERIPIPLPDKIWAIVLAGSKGVVLIDDEDLDLVDQYAWRLGKRGYAKSWIRGKYIRLHKLIMGEPPSGFEIDHVDLDKLNNKRSNLRFVTLSQNRANRLSQGQNKYKGVVKNGKKWKAMCHHIHLGTFNSPEEAARAYDEEARVYFGGCARLNFARGRELSALKKEN